MKSYRIENKKIIAGARGGDGFLQLIDEKKILRYTSNTSAYGDIFVIGNIFGSNHLAASQLFSMPKSEGESCIVKDKETDEEYLLLSAADIKKKQICDNGDLLITFYLNEDLCFLRLSNTVTPPFSIYQINKKETNSEGRSCFYGQPL